MIYSGLDFNAPRLAVRPPIALPVRRKPRVERGALKAAEMDVRAAAMRGKRDYEIGLHARIEICRELLRLQAQKRLRVWVEDSQVFVGPHVVTTGGVQRRRLDWNYAAQVADNPDKHLPAVLKNWTEAA